MNIVKDKLKAGQTVIGTAGNIGSEINFLASAGYDFLQFDTQHTPVEIKALAPKLASMRGRDTVPIIRVGDNQQDQI